MLEKLLAENKVRETCWERLVPNISILKNKAKV